MSPGRGPVAVGRNTAPPRRPPPWYKHFPGDELVSKEYYSLSAAERGLLQSMRDAYWVEGPLPQDPQLLARSVRLPEAEVTRALTAGVLAFFEADPMDPSLLREPLLEWQMQVALRGLEQMAKGGRRGAEKVNSQRDPARPTRITLEHRRTTQSTPGYPARVPFGVFTGSCI